MSLKYIKRLTMLLGSVILVITAGTAQAALQWTCTHGHSGTIEFPDNLDSLTQVHIGWGLDFDQKPGLANWIHFAPPSIHGQQTRFIALQFLTGSNDAFISRVDIYNLGSKVKQFNDVNWSGPLQIQVLDLGETMTFTALGISIRTAAGVEPSSHRFWFSGACASIVVP